MPLSNDTKKHQKWCLDLRKATVCCKRVSGHIRAHLAMRAAVIIIHYYSIILPQHILYNLNISWTNHRQDGDINFGN